MGKRFKVLYIVLTVGLLFVMGCFVFINTGRHANESQITVPQLFKQNKLNEHILDDSESYVSQNYGLRNAFLELYTSLQQKIFQTSAVENVVVGRDGFLYFADTMDDYLGVRQLSEREVFQIVHTLELIQEYVTSQNGQFLFVVAPNKNSLYDYLPYYYVKQSEKKPVQAVFAQLDKVNYVNLFDVFFGQEEILYYKTDSHWNNQGAYLVYQTILDIFEKDYDGSYQFHASGLMKGDLYHMLYPDRGANEKTVTADKVKNYTYLTQTRSTEQNYIESYNEKAQGSLLMFRDSFANNLIDYFSDSYQYAIYDKTIPYNLFLTERYQSDTVIIEIAERNLYLIQQNFPKFFAPERTYEPQNVVEKKFAENLDIKWEADTVSICGTMDEALLETDSIIYVKYGGRYYELTPQMVDGHSGFYGILHNENVKDGELYLIRGAKVYAQKISF